MLRKTAITTPKEKKQQKTPENKRTKNKTKKQTNKQINKKKTTKTESSHIPYYHGRYYQA